MELKIKELPKSEVEIKIEVSAEEFKVFIDKAALNLGKDLEIKGFRKGKVPKEIIEKEAGPENILVEAADLAVKECYRKAVRQLAEENKIEAVSQPKIEIQKLAQDESFIFLAKTAVLPEMKLPDYKKITARVKRKEVVVEEKEISNTLKWLQKSKAKFTLKNQVAQKGDFVEIEYWSPQTSGLNQKAGMKDGFILGEGHFIPGFEEELIGMKAGQEKEGVSLNLPEKHPLRKSIGKKIELKVKVKSVQNVEIPEINDQFAKNLGKFENLTALKGNIKEGLTVEKQQAESQRVRKEILEKITKVSECEIPDVLLEQEQKKMLENFKKNVSENLKISLPDYLKKIKKNEKEILDSFLTEAERKIKNYLVLREIGEREKVEVSGEEIKDEINKILKHYPDIEAAEKNLDLENLEEYTKEVIRNEKIFQLLENLASI